MKWRACLVAGFAAIVVVMTARPALAKGADRATITGPGLRAPIVVGGDGEPGSHAGLGQLSDGSGLFVAMFGPDASTGQVLERAAPAGSLGPRYELTYRVPGNTPPDMLRQDLYPFAAGGPVTYTPAGQRVFGNTTSGGWYHAPPTFSALLTTLGVTPVASVPSPPTTHPASVRNVAEPSGTPAGTPWLAITAAVIGVVVVAAAVFLLVRRSSKARVPSPR